MSSKVPSNVEELPLEMRNMFPGSWWNEDVSKQKEERISELEDKIPQADAIGIVDTDADGLACEIVLQDKYENPVVIQANGGANAISLNQALSLVAENSESDTDVVVADLSPDSTFSAFLGSLSKIQQPLYIYDHHDWKWSAFTSVEAIADEIVVEDGKCAAQILQENYHKEADDTLREFLEVTADHDLWHKEDPRSDHLSTLAFNLERDEYVESALQYGADMVESSDHLREVYETSEKRANDVAEIAINRAEWHSFGGFDVAITYFNCHQSRVGDALLEDGADLAVIVQPTLSISFRSTEEFGKCADLARGLGGGGHPTAAGASIYDRVAVPESLDATNLYIPEIDEDASEISVESMDVHEYVWRTQGRPAITAVEEYLKNSLN